MYVYTDINKITHKNVRKTEFVHSKDLTPNNHSPSSTIFIGGLNENVCFERINFNTSVSCGFVFVC